MEISSTELEKYRLEIFNLKQKIKLLNLKIQRRNKESLYKKISNAELTMLISKRSIANTNSMLGECFEPKRINDQY